MTLFSPRAVRTLHLPLAYCGVFFNDTATTEIYTLSLHDALPLSHAEKIAPDDQLPIEDGHRAHRVVDHPERVPRRAIPTRNAEFAGGDQFALEHSERNDARIEAGPQRMPHGAVPVRDVRCEFRPGRLKEPAHEHRVLGRRR